MSDDGNRGSSDRSRNGDHGANSKRPANVKPRPDHKDGRSSSSHEHEKKEKPVKARRSRSTGPERRERGRRGERGGGERRTRGRSEDGRRRDARDSENEHAVSNAPEDDVEDTECVVCFCSYDNVFKTPKLLSCGHTFCLECLARINVTSLELKALSCPVCREITELPHGRDLPHLGNNQDIFRKLPPEMQRAQSVRFKRNKGKLMLKKPALATTGRTKSRLTLSPKKQEASTVGGEGIQLGTVEQGISPTTVLDVGRPPSRVRGRLRRLFHSDQCYYAVVASIIAITVSLMLVGILAFVVMPHVIIRPPGNSTLPAAGPGGPVVVPSGRPG